MTHPVHSINMTSLEIAKGNYETAIQPLRRTIRTLQLALSGDARIVDWRNGDDDKNDDDDSMNGTSSFEDGFRFEFASSAFSSEASKPEHDRAIPPPIHHPHCSYNNINNNASQGIRRKHLVGSRESTFASFYREDVAISSPENFVFKDPIMVWGNNAPLDKQVCEQLSYAAIYNLALATHLKAQDTLSPFVRRNNFQKALQLYQYAQILFHKQAGHFDFPHLHVMAISNNLSHLHRGLSNTEQAARCMSHLLSIALYCNTRETNNADADDFGRSHQLMRAFLDMALRHTNKNAPAAAA